MTENIKKLHQVNLQILTEVLDIIDSNNLLYYMLGGTMLGAIRHKGFIPWDDDIDIGMPRKDYELFLEIAEKKLPEYYKIINYKTDLDYHYYITRVQDVRTKVIEKRFKHENKTTHASIDIFPIDGTPNNSIMRKIYFFRVLMHRAMMSLHYKDGIDLDRKRSSFEKFYLNILLKLPTDKMFNAYNQKCIIDKLLKKHEMWRSKFSGNIMGAYRTKEIVPTFYYGQDSFFQFEHLKLRGVEYYDKYLHQLYGNYMQIPPENCRKIHFEIIEINNEIIN